MSVVIETTKGIFTVDLFIDERPKGKNIKIRDRIEEGRDILIISDNIRF